MRPIDSSPNKGCIVDGPWNSTFDLSVVPLPCKILWCSTVWKQ